MDKARRFFPIPVTFIDGELPTSTKLNGITTQTRAGFFLAEFMIGDLWNQAGDGALTGPGLTRWALHIPNLARAVGQMSLLNMRVPTSTNTDYFVYDDVGIRAEGAVRAWLRWYPDWASGFTLTGTFAPLVQGQYKTNPATVLATGDWAITTGGLLVTFDPIPAGLVIKYKGQIGSVSDRLDTSTEHASEWNIIPDPSITSGNYRGVKISVASAGGYDIWLPPRRAISGTRANNFDKLPPESLNTGTGNPDAGVATHYYQDPTAQAALTNGNHYRYHLPLEITDPTVVADEQLPRGFIYLWDEDKGTIVEGCEYFSPTTAAHKQFKFRITGTNLDNLFSGYVTLAGSQAAADYTTRFKVIAVGNSLAKQSDLLHYMMWQHDHSPQSGGKSIDHSDLDGNVQPPYHATNNPNYRTTAPNYSVSRWTDDDHPQYLHRSGSTFNAGILGTDRRDNLDNAIYKLLRVNNQVTGATAATCDLLFEAVSSSAARIFTHGPFPAGSSLKISASPYVPNGIGGYALFNDEKVHIGEDNNRVEYIKAAAPGTDKGWFRFRFNEAFGGVSLENGDLALSSISRIVFNSGPFVWPAYPGDDLSYDDSTNEFLLRADGDTNLARLKVGNVYFGSTGITQRTLHILSSDVQVASVTGGTASLMLGGVGNTEYPYWNFNSTGSQTAVLFANVRLPRRATITQLDVSSGAGNVGCSVLTELIRMDTTVALPSAALPVASINQTGALSLLTETASFPFFMDNDTHTYLLKITITNNSIPPVNSNFQFAKIYFTMFQASW